MQDDDKSRMVIDWCGKGMAHGAPGFYVWSEEYPEEGSNGPYDTYPEAVAEMGSECVAVPTHGAAMEASNLQRTHELIDLAEQLAEPDISGRLDIQPNQVDPPEKPHPCWDSMLETIAHQRMLINQELDVCPDDDADPALARLDILEALIEDRALTAVSDARFAADIDSVRDLLSKAAVASAVSARLTPIERKLATLEGGLTPDNAAEYQLRVKDRERVHDLERLTKFFDEQIPKLADTAKAADTAIAERLGHLENWKPRFMRRLDGLQRQMSPEGSPQPDRPDGDQWLPDPLEVAAREVVALCHADDRVTPEQLVAAIEELQVALEAGS